VVIDETGRRMLEVPAGATPNIDGSLEEEAWASAVTTYMDDGTVLLWLRAGGDLYLGVRGDTMGSVNLLVAGDDRIRVLHSSAALGSAVYEARPDGVWHLTRDFEWCCRNPSDREEADLLWDDEGWTATIGPAGHRGEVEFRVALHTGDLRVAVSLVDAAGRAAVWPQGLHPDAVESLYGIRLAEETFMVETWVSVAPA
jgi:hypothetical protein